MLLKVDMTYTWEDGREMDSVLMKTKGEKKGQGQPVGMLFPVKVSVFGLGA